MQRDPEREVEFATWLVKLGACCRQEVDDITQEAYTEALCYQVAIAEWRAFVLESNQQGRYRWFPRTDELLEDLADFRRRRRAPQTHNLLPVPRTAEEAQENEARILASTQEGRAQARENARRGLELIKAAVAKAAREQPSEPAREIPKAPTTPEPVDHEREARRQERLRALQEQAAVIVSSGGEQ